MLGSHSVVGLLSVMVAGAWVQQDRAIQSPRLSHPEYSVYSALLLREGREVVIADTTQPIEICQVAEPHCWIGTVPSEYKAAATSYISRNRTKTNIEDRFPPALRAHLQRGWTGSPVRGCRGTPRLILSRVGFNDDSTRAVVGYEMAVGEGPYPGCGYIAGAVVALRRQSDGVWKIEQDIERWIT